jgi:DNA-binding NtrC family response regulator
LDDGPTRRQEIGSFAVRTIALEVVEGPDAGKRAHADGERMSVGTAEGNGLVLLDPHVSRYHLEVAIGPNGFSLTDVGSSNGTWVGPVRVERAFVQPGTLVRVGATTLRVGEGERTSVDLFGEDALAGFHGRAPATRRLMAQVQRAAQSQAPTLLDGESGTGKEVLARAIHALGPRADQPFEVVDCGALVPALVASELFGHEKGAFTGADRQHVGAFERAGQGTVFLDEIGELPMGLQASLLGALERRRFRRVGGQKEIAFGARVLSATHRDLRAQVNANAFRLDLFYRIAVVTLKVPPLRERPEDIPVLVEHFLREAGYSGPRSALISDQAIGALSSQSWPGNVRELRNTIEALLAMGELPPAGPVNSTSQDPITTVLGLSYKQARDAVLRAFEARYVPSLIERAGGNIAKAARDADMDRSHLMEMMRRLGLR